MSKQPHDPGVPLSGKATVDALADHWAKILTAVMVKQGLNHVVVTADDLRKVGTPDGPITSCIVVQELRDGLHVRIMSPEEAMKLAQQNKGGFGKS